MGYELLQKIYIPAPPAATEDLMNLDGTGVLLTLLPNAKEKIHVYGWGMRYTVAVTASGFNTTAPVMSLQYDAANAGSPVSKSTITVTLNEARAIGREDYGTDFVPFVVNGAAGDALEFTVTTQGAGQTVTGSAIPFILAYTEHLLDGVA